MKSKHQELEEKIDELVKTVDRLEDEWFEYQRCVSRLMTCKLTDPRYPFTDWELLYLQSENERTRFRATLTALQNRLEGKETPAAEQFDVGVVPKEVLYASSKPSRAEVVDILKKVGRQGDTSLLEVMTALAIEFESESKFELLARFVLDGVRFGEEQTP